MEIFEKLECLNGVDTDLNHVQRENYLLFCSNIKRCVGKEGTVDMFKRLFFAEHVGDMYDACHAPIMTCKNGNVEVGTPCIFATMHYGPYKAIGRYLLSRGISLCVPVTQKVYDTQKDSFEQSLSDLVDDRTNLVFVNVEKRSGLISLFKYVRFGYSLLIYLDGNSGIGGMSRDDEKLEDFHFFHETIKIRKGVQFLSDKLSLDVKPILATLGDVCNKEPYIELFPTISSRECRIRNMWSFFCEYMKNDIVQWEGWCYVNSFFKYKHNEVKVTTSSEPIKRFNSERYDFVITDTLYLYDKANSTKVKLSKGLFDLLYTLHSHDCSIDVSNIGKPMLALDLQKSQILI